MLKAVCKGSHMAIRVPILLFICLQITWSSSMAANLPPVPIGAPTGPAPAPLPMPINVTAILQGGGQFNTFLRLLQDTDTVQVFENQAINTKTGITIFAPTDKAFSSVPPEFNLNKLNGQQKVNVMRYHALLAFHPLESLQKFSGSLASTMAGYDLNVMDSDGAVSISTGLVQSPIVSTLYDSSPCAIFAIGKVLLPEEIFGFPAPAPSPAALFAAPKPSPLSLSPSTSKSSSSGSLTGQSSHVNVSAHKSLILIGIVMSVFGLCL